MTASPEDASETQRHLHVCMETLKGVAPLWPSAGRGWELINGCRPSMKPADTVNAAISLLSRRPEDGFKNNRTPPPSQPQIMQSPQRAFPTDKDHSNLQSNITPEGLDGYRGYPSNSGIPANRYALSEQSPSPLPRPYAGAANTTFSHWPGNGDTSFVRSTFNNSSTSHSRNPSVGSQRDPTRVPPPHFWSDPFTDSTLLTSNYYGLPITDRQVQTTGENGGVEFGSLNYASYQGGY